MGTLLFLRRQSGLVVRAWASWLKSQWFEFSCGRVVSWKESVCFSVDFIANTSWKCFKHNFNTFLIKEHKKNKCFCDYCCILIITLIFRDCLMKYRLNYNNKTSLVYNSILNKFIKYHCICGRFAYRCVLFILVTRIYNQEIITDYDQYL